jgi:glutamate racemase
VSDYVNDVQRGAAAAGERGDRQATADAPIGVFDTGVGGLTILRDLLRELPDERYLYFGDTGNCPYGVRPEDEIRRLALAIADFLAAQRVKLMVVACNTISVVALDALRAAHPDIPFVGVVPAVKPAARLTRVGRVGVASTEASARGDYLRRLIAEHAQGVAVSAVGCPRLVLLAEAAELDGPVVEATIREDIAPLLADGVDVLVLGCTHFPAMRPAFERVVGPDVQVIDSGAAIARRARVILSEAGLLANPAGAPAEAPRAPRPADEFWRSGADGASFDRVAAALLGGRPKSRLARGMAPISANATLAG